MFLHDLSLRYQTWSSRRASRSGKVPLSTSGSGASGVGGGGGGDTSGIPGVGGVGAPASAANNTGAVAGSAGLLGVGAGAVMDGGTHSGSSSASGSHTPASSSSSSSAPAPVGGANAVPPDGASGLLNLPPGHAANLLLGAGGATGTGDSESDDSEMGRLQALLEARGLPPHLFGALAPRMQHILHRSMGSNSTISKAQQLIAAVQNNADESQQLQAAIEMCQLLVMGNEDTLAGFPVRQAVPALIHLLHMEHNFDMMNHACRALTYMMEALPRSSAVVVDAVPAFLEKLQVIQCMDVAEQSLTALEMLSRRHAKSILQARGVSACLMYLDFFGINAQRAALSITANCCQNLHADELHFVSGSLSALAARLTQHDKKSVESICIAFSRLVDSFHGESDRLQEIASTELLAHLQQLLVIVPPVLSSATFIMVVRMLSIMCAHCPELAVKLLKQNIAHTLCLLLTGPAGAVASGTSSSTAETLPASSTSSPAKEHHQQDHAVELVARSPQELYEITSLIGELMPRLPTDGFFAVDVWLTKPSTVHYDAVQWQWRDDRGSWHAYSAIDSRMVEAAHQSGEDEISLSTMGRTYTLDFHSMQQINEETGTTRPVQRKINNTGGSSGLGGGNGGLGVKQSDSRIECLQEETELATQFIRSLFSLLYEVYSSSAGPAVRHKCLRALLRMLYYASPELLRDVLKSQSVASHLAGMLSSQDLKIVVGATQMAHILMQKLPDVFGVHFRREGVMHQVQRLVAEPAESPSSSATTPAAVLATPFENDILNRSATYSSSTTDQCPLGNGSSGSSGAPLVASSPERAAAVGTTAATSSEVGESPVTLTNPIMAVSAVASSPMKLSDVLKRKRGAKRGAVGARKSRNYAEETSSGGPPSYSMDGHDYLKSGASASSSSSAGSVGGARSKFGFTMAAHGSGGASNNGTPTSAISGSAAKATSFLANLNPARWGRSHHNNQSSSTGNSGTSSAACTSSSPSLLPNVPKSLSNPQLAGNREKVKTWIRDQATLFLSTYFSPAATEAGESGHGQSGEGSGVHTTGLSVLSELTRLVQRLETEPLMAKETLEQIRAIVADSDVSSFEILHSGLVQSLLKYLTADGIDRDDRLRLFLQEFLRVSPNSEFPTSEAATHLLALTHKLSGCINQLEQFPVRVHDLPAPAGTSGASGGYFRSGTSALRFFNTHQLKCNLQRHPSCNNVKQWKGGTVKIDPLALVQAIEKYLVIRGYGRIRDKDLADSDDDNSEDDVDDSLATVLMNQGNSVRHKLQFLVNDHVIPYNMTVYQAIRQFSMDQSETDTDSETPMGHASIWVQTHTIFYRPVPDNDPCNYASPNAAKNTSAPNVLLPCGSASGTRKGKGANGKSSNKKKGDDLWIDGIAPDVNSPIVPFLTMRMPEYVTVDDPSLEVLNLLRVVHSLNRYWGFLYHLVDYKPILSIHELINSKLTAKANRQLQDPLVIMTGNLPPWLAQIATACPFLFPFETRHLLFYATAFDRDRALQRLMDSAPELMSGGDSSERVTPRLDRRKRTVSREDILKQAEQVMQDMASSRALLEIQYENEVGTGLGPTLEFYALVSRELQRFDLELWRGEAVSATLVAGGGSLGSSPSSSSSEEPSKTKTGPVSTVGSIGTSVDYVHNQYGLFPSPCSRSLKAGPLAKIRSKFRFIGKFIAKAIMDSRMLDLPFSPVFFRWLLGQERFLTASDMVLLDPILAKTYKSLMALVEEKKRIDQDSTLTPAQRQAAIQALNLDGCPVVDLGLDFTLPGSSTIELRKGGKDQPVTINNLEQYLKLLSHWILVEGVSRQMESLREGFESVFPLHHLSLFYPEEMDLLLCGASQWTTEGAWEVQSLLDAWKPDHGFTLESKAIRNLAEILSSYNKEEQRLFLQFVSGSPRLPVGGFKSLSPPLTVVRKTLEPNQSPDDFLPSVMTCVNYLKLPDYSSLEIMRQKLSVAVREGQHSFHLS
ncbi:hypothetical protein OUZ56_006875 [Daphnia magna]|uniref:E3 ubiquitin-protein ligase n=2 Tax=Daphnia magna TaxID=35525 RepID=A0ABQ9YWX8_9CRUS|nr:hypothetical protein OUZ56_006875 [Daphnia magna]